METLIFRVCGEYAHFKKPYSPMSPVSYPFPPPTAVLGLLGAVLGLDKDKYHQELAWDQVRMAVRMERPVRVVRTALNLLNTKDGTDAFFRPKADKNVHIQVPFEFVKDPGYTIYVGNLPAGIQDQLADFLASGYSVYTPALGLAQCLADLRWVGRAEARPVVSQSWQVDSVLAPRQDMRPWYEDGRKYQRFRIPAVMDPQRVVHRYQEVVVAEDAGPVQGQGRPRDVYDIGGDLISFL